MNAHEDAPDSAGHLMMLAIHTGFRWSVYWQTFWGTTTGERMRAAFIDDAQAASNDRTFKDWQAGNIAGRCFKLGYSDSRQWAEDFTSSWNASADASYNTFSAWFDEHTARSERRATTDALDVMAVEWMQSAARTSPNAGVADVVRSACANDPTSPWAQYCAEKQAAGGFDFTLDELFADDIQERHYMLMGSLPGRLLRATVPQFGNASVDDVVAVTSSSDWGADVEKCAALTMAETAERHAERFAGWAAQMESGSEQTSAETARRMWGPEVGASTLGDGEQDAS